MAEWIEDLTKTDSKATDDGSEVALWQNRQQGTHPSWTEPRAKLFATSQTRMPRREKPMRRTLRHEEQMREADAAEDTLKALGAHQLNY
jgi:hypothetical protein